MSSSRAVVDVAKFREVAIPAAAVVAGVFVKRMSSGEHDAFSEDQKDGMEKAGMALFVGGWAYLAWNMWASGPAPGDAWIAKNRNLVLAGACAAVLGSVVVMMTETRKLEGLDETDAADAAEVEAINKRVRATAIGFAAGWFALGYAMSVGRDASLKWIALAAPALVVGSMLFVLPWQRAVGEVDGPGHAMFALAWILLAGLNSTTVSGPR